MGVRGLASDDLRWWEGECHRRRSVRYGGTKVTEGFLGDVRGLEVNSVLGRESGLV